jgi:hypothetical protein
LSQRYTELKIERYPDQFHTVPVQNSNYSLNITKLTKQIEYKYIVDNNGSSEPFRQIATESTTKENQAKEAKKAEDKATFQSQILLDAHRSNGKVFTTGMKAFYNFTEWKTIKDIRNIGSQTEAILCVFFDFPCFFSWTELEKILGYKSPNHNVEGALIKMVQERIIF